MLNRFYSTYTDMQFLISLCHNRVGQKPVCFFNMSLDNLFLLYLTTLSVTKDISVCYDRMQDKIVGTGT